MSVQRLSADETARLRAAALTYEPVGRRPLEAVPGYHWLERTTTLSRTDFDSVAHDLLTWRLQEGAGLNVWASETPLQLDTVVLMRLGIGPASLRIPCRVVAVVEEDDARGFSYGTLPGHPETGEESFVVRRDGDGSVSLTISAFSRPASALTRAGGPLGRAFQGFMTRRYLRALDRV